MCPGFRYIVSKDIVVSGENIDEMLAHVTDSDDSHQWLSVYVDRVCYDGLESIFGLRYLTGRGDVVVFSSREVP
jgi:hypothetical protein